MSKEIPSDDLSGDLEYIIRLFNKLNKQAYGVEPFKIKEDEPTIRELTISEMIGKKVIITK